MTECKSITKPYPLGARKEGNGIYFSFASEKASCGVVLYDRQNGKEIGREHFSEEEKVGQIYYKYMDGLEPQKVSYLFYEEDKLVPDFRARAFEGKKAFGKKRSIEDFRAVIPENGYDWKNDKRPGLKMQDCLCYCMHVRGFTAHSSSQVKNKGCFAGIIEKIPYLKEIGITTLELQPAYEFTEVPAEWEKEEETYDGTPSCLLQEEKGAKQQKLNYWGYKKAFYYAPKSAYSYCGDAVSEFKDLVRMLHANGMELIMQFYFPENIKKLEIPEILRFWVLEYHIDGFHLMGAGLPADMIAEYVMLADTKLWYDSFDLDSIYGKKIPSRKNLALYRDEYQYTMRRFLKGDEGMQDSVLYQMRHIPEKAGRVHFFTNYNSFTLMDLVSYDHKHNEANGEGNKDGSDYNFSWNCGEEGGSRKTKIKELRIKQIKNAMCMLIFTQSTPLIFMGDEFGNSQRGNNNPYCQDNEIAWLDWNNQKKNEELLLFWKKLTILRREHPILHPEQELRLMDYIGCGYPDLSYHGKSAWRPQTEYYSRTVGMMFCGKYAENDDAKGEGFLYFAVNMHWERHELALPKLPKGMMWEKIITTDNTDLEENRADNKISPENHMCELNPRSISVYISTQAISKKQKNRKDPGFKKGKNE